MHKHARARQWDAARHATQKEVTAAPFGMNVKLHPERFQVLQNCADVAGQQLVSDWNKNLAKGTSIHQLLSLRCSIIKVFAVYLSLLKKTNKYAFMYFSSLSPAKPIQAVFGTPSVGALCYCRFSADTDLLLQRFHLLLQSSQPAPEVVRPLPTLLHQVLAGLELIRQLIKGLLRALPVAYLFPVPLCHLGQLVPCQARGLLGLLELTAEKKNQNNIQV